MKHPPGVHDGSCGLPRTPADAPPPSRTLRAGLALACLAAVSAALAQSPLPSPAAARLVEQGQLAYLGAFRLPSGSTPKDSFNFGATSLAFDPEHNTLLLVGHDWTQLVAEVVIPTPAAAGSVESLPTASLRQPLTDVLEGQIGRVGPGQDTVKIGGLLPWNGSLIISAYIYYDAPHGQTKSHFRSTMDFARAGDMQGPFRVGDAGPGFVSGYMTPIPPEWQAAFGGPALTGQCCLPIISRTSFGPALSVFNPADVGLREPVPAYPVLGYPEDHPTLGACDGSSPLFNCTAAIGGVVFPPGTRSILFFGRHGLGKFCYGSVAPEGECVDPAAPDKGPHAFPYAFKVWAYDALDLLAVRNGRKRPWDPRPYKVWTFELPFQTPLRDLLGAAYDPATRRVFLAAAIDNGGRVIHVLQLK